LLRDSARYLIVVVLLTVALAGWVFISRGLASVPGETIEQTWEPAAGSGGAASRVVIIDVEGWYRRTSYERALATAIDFTLRDDLFEGIPTQLGQWRSEGQDSPMGGAVDEWYDSPEVATTREYRDDEGDELFLSIIGSRGGKSFHLFEHTALTCYPGSGWRIADVGLESIDFGDSTVSLQRVIAEKDQLRRVILYWYLWTDPERVPDNGILAVTLHANVTSSDQQALDSLKEFFRLLFPAVMPWRRLG
jgi:EpsI family protein